MYLFQRIIDGVRGCFQLKRRFTVDVKTLESIRLIAESEQTTAQQVATRLVEEGVRRRLQHQEALMLWTSLTPREQEVTALACLRYTNRQIAARLGISPETVKTHLAHSLIKFGVGNRDVLRQALAEWDFREWEDTE